MSIATARTDSGNSAFQNISPELTQAQERMNEMFQLITTIQNPTDEDLKFVLLKSTQLLDLEYGIISRIEGDSYEVISHYSHDGNSIHDGQIFKLGNTYCAITFTQNNIVDISEMSISKYNGHPCYQTFKMESYIGVPLFIDGNRYGTLNFSSASKRQKAFNQLDRDFVLYLSQWVSNVISRSQHEEHLNKQNKQMQELMEERQVMSYTLLHDLKSPINRLSYILDIFKGVYGDPREFDTTYMIEDAITDAKVLIDDLESVTLIDNKVIHAKSDLIHCDDFLADMIGKFEGEAKKKSITLHADLKEAKYLYSDYQILGRIMANLLSNALKFSYKGTNVYFSIHQFSGQIVFEIKDEGPGISDEDQTKMFKKFQKLAASPTHDETSTGLGLYIVKELSELLNAKITVHSELGKGTSIKVYHPIQGHNNS